MIDLTTPSKPLLLNMNKEALCTRKTVIENKAFKGKSTVSYMNFNKKRRVFKLILVRVFIFEGTRIIFLALKYYRR